MTRCPTSFHEMVAEARKRGAGTYKALRYCDRVRLRFPQAVAERNPSGEWVVWNDAPGSWRVLIGISRTGEREAWRDAELRIEATEGGDVFDRLWLRARGQNG